MSPTEEEELPTNQQKPPEGGFSAAHPAADTLPIFVSPATSTEKNRIRMELIPVACWKLNDVRFAFGSSFVLPETRTEFLELGQLRKQHPGAPLSVFGHADPVSDDSFNKELSGHRAESIYAVLIRDTDRWEKLYKSGGQQEGWGVGSIQHMLQAIGIDPGPVTGSMNPQTKSAVESFQGKSDLDVDGDPGPNTRKKLFAAYMDFLCPDKLQKTDFLAKGADKEGKGDLQGCSEFNPVMVFSKAEQTELSKPQNKGKRDEENSANRRVMVLLFRPGTSVQPEKWPCPRTNEGTPGCKKRFWSDGDTRRSPQALHREFGQTKDTFACRFYHRLVISSPCEGVDPNVVLLLKLLKVDDHFCPKQEKLDIVYTLKGFSGKPVRLEITSPHSPVNPIFTKELEVAEKTDGDHTFAWDGKATAEGEFKDAFIHPLFSPYKVNLIHDDVLKDSLEFKVLYHSIELKQGPWTPDEAEPPESEDKKWTALKLNELGFYGGPVEKDTEDYLKKAIIRYKANHGKFRKKFIGDYDDSISVDLKAALKAKEADRKVPEMKAVTDKSAKSVVPVEALTYERTAASADEFGTTRPPHEKDRLNRPLIPVEAVIFVKKKDNSKADEPEAVGPARITWKFADTDEDLTPQFESKAGEPSETKKFIEKALQQHSGRTGSGDNCPVEFAGIRPDGDAGYKTPFLLGDHYVPHEVKDDTGNKAVFSLASTDKAKFPKRQGKAGVLLRPSYIAGDDYRFTAELDFIGRPNKAELEKFHGIADEKTKIKTETGIFTVRRFNNVAMSVEWPGRKSPLTAQAKGFTDYEWDKIGLEFDKAFNDVDVNKIASKKMSDLITEAEYKDLVANHTAHTDKSKIKLLDECMVGVDIPAQGNRNADDYKAFLSTFTHAGYNKKIQTPLGELLSSKIRKTLPTGFVVVNFLVHKPIDIQNDPAAGDTTVAPANKDFVNWAGSIGLADSIVIADMKDPDKVYYVISHEMGHNFYLLHWENTGENNLKNHDQNDHNCSMSYSTSGGPAHQAPGTYTPHFCGKCNLALRGWDITSANLAEKSKTKGGSTTPVTPVTVEVDPDIKSDVDVVVCKTAWTKPARRAITLSVSKTFGGTGTLTRNVDHIKFFDKPTGGKEITFSGGDNEFTGAKLKSGVKLYAEADAPSNRTGDCELTLTLSGGPQTIGAKNPSKKKLTAVQASMGIMAEHDAGKWDDTKVTPGVTVVMPDTDFSHNRALLMVAQVQPMDFACTLRVEVAGTKVAVFNEEKPASGQKALAFPLDIDSKTIPDSTIAPGFLVGSKDFGLEGLALSKATGDCTLKLSIKGIEKDVDVIKVTVNSNFHLHVDADRDGAVDEDRTGFDKWEWGKGKKGAIFLCNNDDDSARSDSDNTDSVVNGGNDKDELAPVVIKRQGGPEPPATWEAELSMTASDAGRVRLFQERKAGSTEVLGKDKGASFKFTDLKFAKKEMGIEACEYAGTSFDGEVELTLKVTKNGTLAYEEKAKFRVAPWMMPSHLDAAEKVFVVECNTPTPTGVRANTAFVAALSSAASTAGCTVVKHTSVDRWMQDCLEWGYSSLPTRGFRSVVRLPRGRELYDFPETLRKADFGATTEGAVLSTASSGSTFNSGGNLECTPPVKSAAGKNYPFGRIYHGKGTRAGEEIDPAYTAFLRKQVVQEPIEIDTDWLTVGHVDEVISIAPGGPKGFKVVLASPKLAYDILDANLAAHGTSKLLTNRSFPRGSAWASGEVTISDFLSSGLFGHSAADLRDYNLTSHVQPKLDTIKSTLKTELGLADSDFLEFPILFIENDDAPPFSDALTAGIVNMLVVNKTCLVPKPFGPVVSGQDLFGKEVKDKLGGLGLNVQFVDDWYDYHVQLGEVHCGSNTLRAPTKAKWWEFEP